MRNLLKTGASLTAITLLSPVAVAHAEDITISLEAVGGLADDNSFNAASNSNVSAGAIGSVNFDGPVAIQIDGLAFEHRDNTAMAGALHLGSRTSGGTFIGLYGSMSDIGLDGNLTTTRIGGEIDRQLGDFRLSLVAGFEDLDSATYLVGNTPTLRTFESYGNNGDVFAFSDFIFQPGGDGAALSVGHRFTGGHHALAVGTAIPVTSRLSFTGHARLGGGDYSAGLLGLRLVFGAGNVNPGNLLQNRLIEDLFAPGNTRRVSTQVIALPAPPPPPPGCGSCGGYCST